MEERQRRVSSSAKRRKHRPHPAPRFGEKTCVSHMLISVKVCVHTAACVRTLDLILCCGGNGGPIQVVVPSYMFGGVCFGSKQDISSQILK